MEPFQIPAGRVLSRDKDLGAWKVVLSHKTCMVLSLKARFPYGIDSPSRVLCRRYYNAVDFSARLGTSLPSFSLYTPAAGY